MAIEVASAFVSVGGDTRQLSKDITSFFKTLKPTFNMDNAFTGVEKEAEKVSKKTGKQFETDLGKGFEEGAKRAQNALDRINASSLKKITQGAQDADKELRKLNRWQLDNLIREANKAGEALGTEIPKGASEAERAIRSLNNQGLEKLLLEARAARKEIDELGNTTGFERLHKKIDPVANKAGKISGIFTGLVTVAGAAGIAVGSVGGPIALLTQGIGAMAVTAGGAGVAGLAALGAGVASVKLATLGLDDVFKNAFDPKKADEFNAALQKMGPQTRGMVLGATSLAKAWQASGAQTAIQEALFTRLGTQIGRLSQYMNTIKNDMVLVNRGLNDGANAALNFVNSSQGVGLLTKGLGQASNMAANVGRGLGALVPGLTAVGASALNVFSPMTNGFQGMAEGLSKFLLEAQQTGQIDAFFQRMWTITKQIGTAFLELGGIVGGVFRAMATAGGGNPLGGIIDKLRMVNDFVNGAQGQNALATFFESTQKAVGALLPPLLQFASVIGTTVAPIVSQMIQTLGPALTPAIVALGQGLADSAPQFQAIAETAAAFLRAITPILPFVVQLAPAILLMVGAWKVYSGVMAVQTALEKTRLGTWVLMKAAMVGQAAVTGVVTAAQWAWNAAMTANPIGLIIVAIGALVGALVWFFTKTELGREIWTNVWGGIQVAISYAWNNVIKPIIDALVAAVKWVGDAAVWLWHNVMEPVWNGISKAISWVWDNVVNPIFQGWKLEMQLVGQAVEWLWDNVIKPVWNGIGNTIKWVIENIVYPAFQGLKSALGSVGNFFSDVVEGIKNAWNAIKKAVAVPINFVIETVWNNGLLKAWNAVAGWLPGLKPAAPLQPVAFMSGGTTGRRDKDHIPALLAGNEHVFDGGDVDALGGQANVYALRHMLDLGIPFSWDAVNGLKRAPRGVAQSIASAPVGGDLAGFLRAINVPGYKTGGSITPDGGGTSSIRPLWEYQLQSGHEFAKAHNHEPYIWGEWDCSAYMSRIADKILGGPGNKNWATASFPGSQPWEPGLGPGFSVGVHDDPGGPGGGHTAGTLGAAGPFGVTNVESGGAHGNVMYGETAVGADNAQFVGVRPGQFHLGIGADGAFKSGGSGSGPSRADQEGFLKNKIREVIDSFMNPVRTLMGKVVPPPPPELYSIPPTALNVTRDAAVNVATGAVGFLGDKLGSVYTGAKNAIGSLTHGVGSIVGGITSVFRDTGGYIPNGVTLVRNETGKPEAVLNWEQLTKVRDLMKNGLSMMDAVHAVGSLSDAKGADVIGELSTHSNAQQLDTYMYQKKMETVTRTSTREFMGSAGKIIGESLFDIFSPSDKIPDPLALMDRYTIKSDEQKQQAQTGGTYGATPYQSPQSQYEAPQTMDRSNYDVTPDPVAPLPDTGGSGGLNRDAYLNDTVSAAKQLGLPFKAAVIGVATELVESNLKMYANSNVPESLNYPHEAVGSDGTSTGTFQQQQNGAWGGLDSTMNVFKSATSFFNALSGFDWQSMDPGAAAQKVQQSAYPSKYAGRMGEAEELLKGKFDNGGIVRPGLNVIGNYTGGAEHMGILTDPQWASLQLAAEAGVAGGGDDFSINIQQLVVRDLHEWERANKSMAIRQSMKSRGRSRT